jgi:hypothetical protein
MGGGIAIQDRMAFAGGFFAERYGPEAATHAPPIRQIPRRLHSEAISDSQQWIGEGETMNYIVRMVRSRPRSTASGQIDF